MRSYVGEQDAVRSREGIEASGSSLLDMWGDLIAECETGYQWEMSELRNELRVRDQLQTLAAAPTLQAFAEHRDFEARLRSLDDRFRTLLRSDVEFEQQQGWWRRGVLRFAGPAYCDYCKAVLGVEIEKRSQ